MRVVTLPTNYYQQFDADYSREIPAEGYGAWKKTDLPLNLDRTALVVMHAADVGAEEQFPGHFRAVEYIPRSYEICRTVFPGLLGKVRESRMKLIHVPFGSIDYESYPGYQKVVDMSKPEPGPPTKVEGDATYQELLRFKSAHVHPGTHNQADIKKGGPFRKFLKEAEPIGDEPIALTSHQLYTWCQKENINHLIYVGFAINWCLLVSPGGMVDMSRKGILCSSIREAVTAVENKETARSELNKKLALWRVALAYGFVYDVDQFTQALGKVSNDKNHSVYS